MGGTQRLEERADLHHHENTGTDQPSKAKRSDVTENKQLSACTRGGPLIVITKNRTALCLIGGWVGGWVGAVILPGI